MTVVLTSGTATCGECGHKVHQTSGSRDHVVSVLTEAMNEHYELEHPCGHAVCEIDGCPCLCHEPAAA